MDTVSHGLKHKIKAALGARIKLGQIFGLSESELERLIVEVEKNPLFLKLTYPAERCRKVVQFQRFPQTRWLPLSIELKEEILPAQDALDIASMASESPERVSLIRRIGEERFARYFLYAEEDAGILDIAQACGVGTEEAQDIVDFVNEFQIRSIQSGPSNPASVQTPARAAEIGYTLIARVEKDAEGWTLVYMSLSQARGRYRIRHDRLEELKKEGAFSSKDLARLKGLLGKLEFINERKNSMNRLLKLLLARQSEYLESGDPAARKALSQREAARSLELDPSSVSRLVFGKSILTSTHREVPLKEMFLSKKRWLLRVLEEILPNGGAPCPDRVLRKMLWGKTGIWVSRRSIAQYREDLGVSCSRAPSFGPAGTRGGQEQ
ncbi:MAG: hypothetical protein HY402_05380 [Elusimicrobia bacterium]|nr:hypothetical protein [Elusimicrobiota bacterium]